MNFWFIIGLVTASCLCVFTTSLSNSSGSSPELALSAAPAHHTDAREKEKPAKAGFVGRAGGR